MITEVTTCNKTRKKCTTELTQTYSETDKTLFYTRGLQLLHIGKI